MQPELFYNLLGTATLWNSKRRTSGMHLETAPRNYVRRLKSDIVLFLIVQFSIVRRGCTVTSRYVPLTNHRVIISE